MEHESRRLPGVTMIPERRTARLFLPYAVHLAAGACLIALALTSWTYGHHRAVAEPVSNFARWVNSKALGSLPSRPLSRREFSEALDLQLRGPSAWPSPRFMSPRASVAGRFWGYSRDPYSPRAGVVYKPKWRSIVRNPYTLWFWLCFFPVTTCLLWSFAFPDRAPVLRRVFTRIGITAFICLPLPAIMATYLNFYCELHIQSMESRMNQAGGLPLSVHAVRPGTLAATAGLLLVMYPVVFLHLSFLSLGVPRRDPLTCGSCGYERGELDACPECGSPRDLPPKKLSKTKRRVLIAGYASFPLLLIAPFWISWIDIGLWHLRN